MNAFACHFEKGGSSFGPGVRGADGKREFSEGTRGRTAILRDLWQSAKNLVNRQRNADDAGGAHEEFLGVAVEPARGFFDGANGSGVACVSSGAIGVASVDDDGAHATFGLTKVSFRNDYGGGNDQILGEDGSSGSRNVAGDESKIKRACFLKATGGGRETKSTRESGFGESVLHVIGFRVAGPAVTEGTSDPPRDAVRLVKYGMLM
jgi:hypothetical protein